MLRQGLKLRTLIRLRSRPAVATNTAGKSPGVSLKHPVLSRLQMLSCRLQQWSLSRLLCHPAVAKNTAGVLKESGFVPGNKGEKMF